MNDWTNLADAVRLGGWVVYPLTLLAVVALAIMLDRAYAFWRFARVPGRITESLASAGQGDGDPFLSGFPGNLPQQHALNRLGRVLTDGRAPLWRVESKIEAIAAQIERDMSRGLWLLETIVTAAPLLGLLGTIVGMMHSFRLIGGDGLVNPAGVSGGVAQALVATALGLVIALVALFAFNYFSRRLDRLMDELESCANEWLGDLRLADEHRSGQS
ncbi:MotA/TolQ/ExbB proton channel [Caballeronia catudaia]|uniref:MotA/TolQ/ExbB proton channel n=1 Tax=Caballeronia catudaia TaxID=1777136 RepID=A0A158DME9_9BURK|nr:MotA/TolQ/ExbB proton channel family protein [Caballeronia catudaia]SAK95821.1 MotA/TolQ/ExbB proton channel [Caballeronia catudaia]